MYKIEYNPNPNPISLNSQYVAPYTTVDDPDFVDIDLIDTNDPGWIKLTKNKAVIKLLPSHRVKAITYVE